MSLEGKDVYQKLPEHDDAVQALQYELISDLGLSPTAEIYEFTFAEGTHTPSLVKIKDRAIYTEINFEDGKVMEASYTYVEDKASGEAAAKTLFENHVAAFISKFGRQNTSESITRNQAA